MKSWIEFTYLLRHPYRAISKDSVVSIKGEWYMVKRIDQVILLDEAVKEPGVVHVFARGIKLGEKEPIK